MPSLHIIDTSLHIGKATRKPA